MTQQSAYGVSLAVALTFAMGYPPEAPAQQSLTDRSVSRDTLATMQSGVITARDLLERLELMPWPGKERPSVRDSIREKALSALIAEHLLAAEFERTGLQESDEVQRLRQGLESVLLRDLLFKEEVSSGIDITPDEIAKGLERYREERTVVTYRLGSEAHAIGLAARLRETQPHDSLSLVVEDPRVLQRATLIVTFGSLERTIEDSVYAAKPPAVTGPVFSPTDGWLVFAVVSGRPHEPSVTSTRTDRRTFVETVVRTRKESARARSVYFGILAERRARADSVAFEKLATSLGDLWREDSTTYFREDMFQFLPEIVERLIDRLGPFLDDPLIHLENGSIRMGEVLELLRYEQFGLPTLDPMSLRLDLNERVKAMTANELLAREARRRGLHRTDTFRRDMRVWDAYWKSRRLYDQIRDTVRVTEGEVLTYLLDNRDVFGDRFEVSVREVLSPTREASGDVLRALAAGETMAALARERTIRNEWRSTDGESGFFAVGTLPEIGFRALLAPEKSLVGPVPVPGGVSVFTPLAKRMRGGREIDADSFRVALHQRLLEEKRRTVTAEYVRGLARQENVSIRPDALARVRVTSVNMFTRRYLGFGGIMTAVPMLSHTWDWLIGLSDDIQVLP